MSIELSVRSAELREPKPAFRPYPVSALCTYPIPVKPRSKSGLLAGLAHGNEFPLIPQAPNQASEDSVLAAPLAGELTVAGLLAVLPTGVIILDKQGRVKLTNPAAERLLGSGLLDQYWRDIIAANFDPREDDGHEVSLISGKRVSLMTRSLAEGEGQLIVLNDLSETRELQNQLNRHQRLSAMGQMMSSLAHQIRTPLAAALLHADNLAGLDRNSLQVNKSASKIISRLHNIERQIRDMLVFAKGGCTPTMDLKLETLVVKLKEAAADLESSYARNISWQWVGEAEIINCNPDALQGAFLNLLENAMQASDRNEPINVEIRLAATASGQNNRVLIRVINTGADIDAATLKKLEEPFQSTKPNGTGLGLAIVKLVCQSHNGHLRMRSEAGSVCCEMDLPVKHEGGKL